MGGKPWNAGSSTTDSSCGTECSGQYINTANNACAAFTKDAVTCHGMGKPFNAGSSTSDSSCGTACTETGETLDPTMNLCECVEALGKTWDATTNMCVDAAHYKRITSGKCTDTGYALVASGEECRLAAKKLRTSSGYSRPDSTTANSNSYSTPRGCYEASNVLYFNSYSSSVSCSSSRPCLCRTSSFASGAYALATNDDECHEHITSAAECAGATELVLHSSSQYLFDGNWWFSPRGCYRYEQSGNTFFNHGTDNRAGYQYYYETYGWSSQEVRGICRTTSFYHPDHDWHDTGARITCETAGFEYITNQEDCQTAAGKLDFDYANSGSWSNMPRGCFRSLDSVYWNTYTGAIADSEDGAWSSSSTRSNICGVRV